LLSISAVLPGFPQTHAPWPVWRGSVAGYARFVPMTRKAAAQLWHAARRWDRETHQPGQHGGIIGRVALDVFYVLALDFQNFRTGRLDPSLDAIAAKACCCRRSVVTALARLRDLGMLSWLRRCEEERDEAGRFRLRQRTNAYAVLPPSQWKSYCNNDPLLPDPTTLGAPERVSDPIEAAVSELIHGQRKASLAALEADPGDALALALAGFSRAVDEREARTFTGVHELPRNTPLCSTHTSTDQFAAPRPPEDNFEALKRWHIQHLLGTDEGS
jgi:hypothetical protein